MYKGYNLVFGWGVGVRERSLTIKKKVEISVRYIWHNTLSRFLSDVYVIIALYVNPSNECDTSCKL